MQGLYYEVWIGKGKERRAIKTVRTKKEAVPFLNKYKKLSDMVQNQKWKHQRQFNSYFNPRIKKVDNRW